MSPTSPSRDWRMRNRVAPSSRGPSDSRSLPLTCRATPPPRATQIGFLGDLAAEMDPPVVAVGDLNSSRKYLGPLFAAGLKPGPRVVRTVPSRFPRVQLDHILVGPGARLTETRSIRTHISDHRPLLGTIEPV